MFTVTVIVSILLALAALGSATGKLTRQPKLLQQMNGLGVPLAWLPRLALAEIAGAVGLLVGLAVPVIGVLAAIGLVAYFVGAVVTHLKAGDNGFAPAGVLAAVALVAMIVRVASA